MDLTQEEWSEKLIKDTKKIILDVRTEQEVEEGRIPESINIDFYAGADFIKEIKQLNKKMNYYVYCRAGGRSEQACAIMKQMGFETVYNLKGGFDDWKGDIEE